MTHYISVSQTQGQTEHLYNHDINIIDGNHSMKDLWLTLHKITNFRLRGGNKKIELCTFCKRSCGNCDLISANMTLHLTVTLIFTIATLFL